MIGTKVKLTLKTSANPFERPENSRKSKDKVKYRGRKKSGRD